MNMTIVTAVIAMIEKLLPLLGTSGATISMIESVIAALEQFMPLIIEFVPVVYSSVKNITIALRNILEGNTEATKAQWDAIDAIDAQLDAANDAAIAAVDPDAPQPT